MELSYDRGTLLLLGMAAPMGASGVDPGGWAGVVWDPRVGAYRAPAWRYAEVLERLRGAGVVVADGVDAWKEWRVYGWREVVLRPYQAAALYAWRAAGRRGVVSLPTGSGKTWVALAAMAHLQVPTLCVVPTRVLMHQWCSVLGRVYDGPVGVWGDGRRRLYPVTVTTFESAYRHMAQWGQRFGLMVVDEAHHFGQSTRDLLLEMSAAPARLGLTATPPDPGPQAQRLEELLGPRVFRARLAELQGQYLADFHRLTLVLELSAAERSAYDLEYGAFRAFYLPYRSRNPGGAWADFLREAARSDEGRRSLAAWRASRRLLAFHESKGAALRWLLAEHSKRRVLIFTPDNHTAYRVAVRHLVMPITCDIGRAERARSLELFREGRLRALVSSRVLNEGVDVPEADVGIIVGGTSGPREYLQRLGRILRPAPGKHAELWELITRATPESNRVRQREMTLGSDLPTPILQQVRDQRQVGGRR
jgi:superfamily II DNA or RNA helicase